ncbi:histone-lysine N-methyltransferase eggless-like isoform X2 [Bradysia coprophila]|uniref:histone-lysine N-methyltransferase eggless-like isoform X2 n=1 Tax=Bradysia coprophila TaxID=38358 RepID=UPI00187D766C|nr:histone-lysine N-methyltransferase eggless-like isoform X2 [Bradysia coprophila]
MDKTPDCNLDRIKDEPAECKNEPLSRCDGQANEFVDNTSIMVSVPLSASEISEIDSIVLNDSVSKEVENDKPADVPPVEPMEVNEQDKSDIPDANLTEDIDLPSTATQSTTVATCDKSIADPSSTQPNIEKGDDTNVDENDVVMLLSDSEDEDTARKSRLVDTAEMIEKFSTQGVTLEVVKPANDKLRAASVRTENVENKTNDNDTSVIMLDDSPREVEAPTNDRDSAKRNAIEVDEEPPPQTANETDDPAQNALQMIRQLVDGCYPDDKESTAATTATTTTTTTTASKSTDSPAPNESQKTQSTFRLVGMDKLLETNSVKSGEKRECINFDCKSKKSVEFYKAPLLALSHFNVPRKVNRAQFICQNCFDVSVNDYERMGVALVNQQPLLLEEVPVRPEVVEILDSEEEDNGGGSSKYVDDIKPLSLDTLTLLEDHFEDVLKEAFNRINIAQQMAWTDQILNHKIDKNETKTEELELQVKSMQKLADSMYDKLYKNTNFVIEELPPFDLNENKQLHMYGPNYPPQGELIYPPVDMNSLYYAVRAKLLTTWIPCKVTERVDASVDGKKMFKVRFLRTKGVLNKTVPGNHLAYGTAPSVRLTVGTRVIALFTMEPHDNLRSTFFPGIVAEPLQQYNKWRYLIFFDDGYAQYVTPDNLRLICSPSPNVWEDVYPDAAEFIKSYLEQYKTQRPMVQVKRGQRMITEWNSEWTHARVHDIDGSLVQMYFENAKRSEWIYRGSTRLGPLYKDRQLQKHSVSSGKRNEPFVEYMTIDDDGKNKTSTAAKPVQAQKPVAAKPSHTPNTSSQVAPQSGEEKRSVARKSVTAPQRPQPAVQHMNSATIYIEEDNRPKGKVVYYTAKKHMPPRKFVPHKCGVGCLYEVKHNLSTYSPLAKPLLSGWERKILRNKTKKSVEYRTPCGRNLRNMAELHRYLRQTKCALNVDNFDFDFMVHCLAEYVIDTCVVQKQDLSDGCEPMVVPCVNSYDNTMPPPCVYSAKRIPNEGVNLNLDTNFMCGCDCEDDCMDKSKCQCWKLTLDGAQFGNPNTPIDQVGYEFKRLPNPVPTGIYECNTRCKCSKTCLNRVAQHPLQLKLQVFKTVSRGWGLRCLNDVPKGSFICIYAGDLLTEQNANIAGDNYGDEYFAELDYIEVVENLKEGYEPGVMDDDFDDDEFDPDKTKDDSDDDEYVATVSQGPRQTRYNTRHSVDASNKKKTTETPKLKVDPASGSNSDEEDAQRQLISFMPNADSVEFENNTTNRYRSIRKFYGKNESVFIMDAKKLGNIGRYFNHSCSPNLFVQNVFVDTHDLRFPWVAFFALSHIRAGSELTWNYNYDVGSVPGKVMYCECGAENCRGRLL